MNKHELRKHYKSKRNELTNISTLSKQIAEHFSNHFLSKHIELVHLFLSMENEVDMRYVIEDIYEHYPTIKIATSITNWQDNTLSHTLITPKTSYKYDAFNIPTPQETKPCNLEKVDLVLVPLLCVDKLGNRIGYGKGFYDGFLSTLPKQCKKIGVGFFEPIPTPIQTFPTDVPLDGYITPKQVFWFN